MEPWLCWAKEIRELSYDIDDSITDFLHRVESNSNSKPHGLKGFINRIMNLLTTINSRREIAKELQGLKRRVMEVSERRKRYKVDDAISKPNNTTIDLRLLALYAETAGLVGIDGPRDELIQLMNGEGVPVHQLTVISIVGFGGLGKTTLANEIYRKLEGQFQCRAFVSVSQKPNMRKILRTILSQAGFVATDNSDMELWEENELISALRRFLLNNRYVMVIDDIWKDSAWDIISCALPENRNGSIVITTTRIESVARKCCVNHSAYVYKMKPLSEQDSRSLFFRRVFGSEDACPPFLKEVSAEILKKCGGLPLAIITISSLLANQPNKLKKQWEYVRNSLGSNFEVNPSLEGMRQILNLSYINLPPYLKTCMLYLGIYPEDHTIHKNDLARQWVAEGFICKARGTDPEDVAKGYFNELINRSMIQPTDAYYNSEVMSCRVHDMMLDLILHKSREENFISVMDDIQVMTGVHSKVRRLSLQLDGSGDGNVFRSVQLSKIRTLATFSTSSFLPPFVLFKHLRVLTIEISERSWFSPLLDFTGICHLFQLRYLKIIAIRHHVELPHKIGHLQKLESLYIETEITPSKGENFERLPLDIVHMGRLSHLVVPWWRTLPNGIGNMKSLRALRCFDLGINSLHNMDGLQELTNLTDLEIGWHSYIYRSRRTDQFVAWRSKGVFRTCLEKLCNLKHLRMNYVYGVDTCLDVLSPVTASFCHLQTFHAFGSWFSRVPEWITQLHDLYDLDLTVKEVLEDDVGMLAQLSSLSFLSLLIQRAPRDKIIVRGSGFPVLKCFRVVCSRISYLAFEAGAMAKVEKLELRFNAKGWDWCGAVPAGIDHLSSLKEISVDIGGAGAKESNRRAAESAMRNAIDMHPSRPTVNMECNVDSGVMFDDEENEWLDQDDDSSNT